jgi:hypothetical protein
MPYKEGVNYVDLIKHFGSQAAVARALKLQQPSVFEWKKKGIPEKRQLEIEQYTGGVLKAHPRVKAKYRALLGKAA